jgi:hypothetical protein
LNNEGGPQSATKSSEHEGSLTILQVFRHPDYKKAAIAVVMVMLAQQFSGINSIVMYGVSLLAGLLPSTLSSQQEARLFQTSSVASRVFSDPSLAWVSAPCFSQSAL